MKLVIATGIFPPAVGGPATYSKEVAEALTKRGHGVSVVTYGNPGGIGKYDFPVRAVKLSVLKPIHYLRYYGAVKKFAQSADLIYAQGPISEGYPAYLAAKKLHKPLVVKVVGDRSWEAAFYMGLTEFLPEEFQTQDDYPARIRKMRDIQRRVCGYAKRVIVPSQYLKKIVSMWGIPKEKIVVIGNAVELPRLGLSRDLLRKKLGTENKFLVTSIGRDVPWKGFSLLEKIAEELRKRNEGIELKVLKNTPHEQAMQWLAASDLYVQNTGYEGFPHLLVEAAMLDVPILTTRVGGNTELIADMKNGKLVDFNNAQQIKDAILWFYNNRKQAKELAHEAKGLSERYNLPQMINDTEKELQACVS